MITLGLDGKAIVDPRDAAPKRRPNPANVTRWVKALEQEHHALAAPAVADAKRRRADIARANLAKYNLGANGLPLGRIQ